MKIKFYKTIASILALVMLMSVFPMQISIFADAAENVDLSVLSELSENKTEATESYSYVWTVEEIDGETVKTLELTLNGANIETLTLPCKDSGKLYIIINTQSDSYIESICESYVFYYTNQWDEITFEGEGALELGYMETQGGGNDHIITISEGANLSITGEYSSLSFGASGSSNSTLNVDGTLLVNGNVSCGQAIIGTNGSVICERLCLAGTGAFDTDDEKDAFVLRDGGSFDAKGDTEWYDTDTNEFYAALFINVDSVSDLTAEEIINIPDGILSLGYSLYRGDNFATVDDGEEHPVGTSFDTGVIYAAISLKLPAEAETYTVVWKNHDGEILETDENVEYGTVPTYDGEEPVKQATAEYTYTFTGWSPNVEEVTGDIEYTAEFTETKNAYTVVWKNHDGEVLETDENVEYGTVPTYDGEEPVKQQTAEYTYTFTGWTPNIEEVTGDIEYTAEFTETKNAYTVVWKNHDGEVLETDENVEYGTVPTYDGEEPVKQATAEYTYTFTGWSPNVEEVTGDIEYTAEFTEIKNTYTVVWKNHDGEVLETDENVEHGTVPTYDGEEPVKQQTAEYTYTFTGWTPNVEEVTGDIEYTATFNEIPVVQPAVYTITFNSKGGSDIMDASVNEGEKLTKPANPTRSGYNFVGWYEDASLTNEYNFDNAVISDFTLFAKWQKKSNSGGGGVTRYTVSFETEGGTKISDSRVTRNTKLVKPEDPVKDDYVFDGWYTEKNLENLYDFESKVTKSFTLYAKWRKTNVADILNTNEHFAYIKGYGNNTVRPENNITRAETTEIFFRLLNEETRNANLAYTNNFADTADDAWYNTSVSTMAKLGIVKGKTNIAFAPDEFITRAEFAVICARFDESEFEITDTFTDISGHWAETEIYEAAAHGWIKGYNDGTFRPDEFITRAEAITMINRMLGRTPETVDDLNDDMIKWADNSDESAWYYIAIQEATNDHSYVKNDNGNEKWN